jgi:hypothetical protein
MGAGSAGKPLRQIMVAPSGVAAVRVRGPCERNEGQTGGLPEIEQTGGAGCCRVMSSSSTASSCAESGTCGRSARCTPCAARRVTRHVAAPFKSMCTASAGGAGAAGQEARGAPALCGSPNDAGIDGPRAPRPSPERWWNRRLRAVACVHGWGARGETAARRAGAAGPAPTLQGCTHQQANHCALTASPTRGE